MISDYESFVSATHKGAGECSGRLWVRHVRYIVDLEPMKCEVWDTVLKGDRADFRLAFVSVMVHGRARIVRSGSGRISRMCISAWD